MSASESPKAPRPVRFHAEIPASVHYRGVDYPCVAHNLSRSGVLLEGGIPWPADDSVEFSLLTSTGDLEVRLRGRVVRISEDDGGQGTVLAIEFVDLEPDPRKGLENLLSRVIERHPPTEAGIESIRPGTPPHEIRKILEGIPLPDRIALAIRAKPLERESLRHDAHAAVVESLLRNPGISAGEIATLLSSPAVSPSMLEALSRDTRWERHTDLRISIATHPRVPRPVAERIVDQLPTQELRKVMKQPTLTPALRSRMIRRLGAG